MSFIGPPLDLNGSIKSVEEKTVSLFEQTGKFEERLESTSFYRYDKSKNLIEWRYLIPGKTNSKTTYLYNEQNQLIKISYYF